MLKKNLASLRLVRLKWHSLGNLIFMNHLFAVVFIFFSILAHSQFKVENYYDNSFNGDWGKAFTACFSAMDSVGHGNLELDGSRNYRFMSDAELPRFATSGRRIFVINGNGGRVIFC